MLLAKDIYEDTFAALGSDLYDHIELRRVEPAYAVFLSDDTKVSLTADLHVMQKQLEIDVAKVSATCQQDEEMPLPPPLGTP